MVLQMQRGRRNNPCHYELNRGGKLSGEQVLFRTAIFTARRRSLVERHKSVDNDQYQYQYEARIMIPQEYSPKAFSHKHFETCLLQPEREIVMLFLKQDYI